MRISDWSSDVCSSDLVLGRTKSGTLTLTEDDTGLAFALDMPDTAAARDLIALAERGDLGGASFGFNVPKDGDAWTGNSRELRNVNLAEVSIVSRSEEHTSELQSLMRISYAVFCLIKKTLTIRTN